VLAFSAQVRRFKPGRSRRIFKGEKKSSEITKFSQTSTVVHSRVCLTVGPQPLPKPVLHGVKSSASSFNFQCLPFSLRSSSSCLPFLPRLTVTCIHFLYISFNNVLPKAVSTQNVSNPVSPSLVLFRMFHSSLTQYNSTKYPVN
jgi:hypothetical protein